MLAQIGYYLILGKPVIFYLGIGTFLFLYSAAAIAIMNLRGIHRISFKWHPRIAIVGLVLGLLHAILALAAYL